MFETGHAVFGTNVEAVSFPVDDPVLNNVEGIDRPPGQTVSHQTGSAATWEQTASPDVHSPAAVISPEPLIEPSALASHQSDTGTMKPPVSFDSHKSIHAVGGEDVQLFRGQSRPSIPGEMDRNLPGGKQEHLEQNLAANVSLYATMNLPTQGDGERVPPVQGTLVTKVPPNVSARINPRQDKSLKETALLNEPTEMNRVINVSIGRIDVRATHPAPGLPQRREKPAGVMTLEQYLNRHSKGGNL